ncbi:MAG: universal stress protein [Burkholderiales bacterium]|nr:universal stress protein [Burkholderiales bacterium]
MLQQILLAYDGSDEGRAALTECGDLAASLGAKVHLLAVIPFYAGIIVAEGMIIKDNYERCRGKWFRRPSLPTLELTRSPLSNSFSNWKRNSNSI